MVDFTGFYIVHTMNKTDLIDRVAEVAGLSKTDTERAIEGAISEITAALKRGEEVAVAGLGKFSTRSRAARVGRNPRTGESVQIAASRVPKFSASKTLKDALK